jgi:hypothetical protein
VDYKGLKKLIAASVREDSARNANSPQYASLSIARDPRIAAEDQFHLRLNDEMEKVRMLPPSVLCSAPNSHAPAPSSNTPGNQQCLAT